MARKFNAEEFTASYNVWLGEYRAAITQSTLLAAKHAQILATLDPPLIEWKKLWNVPVQPVVVKPKQPVREPRDQQALNNRFYGNVSSATSNPVYRMSTSTDNSVVQARRVYGPSPTPPPPLTVRVLHEPRFDEGTFNFLFDEIASLGTAGIGDLIVSNKVTYQITNVDRYRGKVRARTVIWP